MFLADNKRRSLYRILCVNCGANSNNVADNEPKINVLPLEVKEKTKRFVERVSLQAVAVGMIVGVLLFLVGLNVRIAANNKKIEAMKFEQKTLIPQQETVKLLLIADRIQSAHPHWEDALREISHVMEPKMYLTGMKMEDDVVNLKGVITQNDQTAQAVLSNFMIRMEDGIFKRVSLVSSKRQVQGEMLFEFEITAEVE